MIKTITDNTPEARCANEIMKETKEILKLRLKHLEEVWLNAKKALASAPEGFLRVSSNSGNVQYYHRIDPKDPRGCYIRKDNKKLASALAYKDYHQKRLKSAEQEMKAIRYYLLNCPKTPVEDIYQGLHPSRQKLILPIEETDEMFLERWQSYVYIGKEFSSENTDFITDRGEPVRSKSELIIANLLNKENIAYRYECPVYLEGFGTVYPDFTVLNLRKRKEVLWEHHGMMDDPEYVLNSIRKWTAYEANGYFSGKNLIRTFETKDLPLNTAVIQRMIEEYLI